MKTFILTCVLFLTILISFAQQDTFPELIDPYFGQTPPGTEPELFAPEILVKDKQSHSNIIFSADGTEAYWCYNGIWFSRVENGFWTAPKLLPFSEKNYVYDAPFLSTDNTQLFFTSNMPATHTDTTKTENIWVVDRNNGEWSEPKLLPAVINDPFFHWQVSVDNNGTLYFTKYEFETNLGQNNLPQRDIWFSKFDGKNYLQPEPCSKMINSEHYEVHPFISPEGDYIIFSRINTQRLPDGHQDISLFISFKKKDNTWTEAINLKDYVKYNDVAMCPIVTQDGDYLFFLDSYKGKYQRYWVSAKFIEELRPTE